MCHNTQDGNAPFITIYIFPNLHPKVFLISIYYYILVLVVLFWIFATEADILLTSSFLFSLHYAVRTQYYRPGNIMKLIGSEF